MTYQLAPLGARLLVRLRPQAQKGMIVRINQQDSARAADVVSVGPDVRDVEVGRGVLISALAGQEVGDQVLLPESSVLAFLDD